MKRAAVLLDVDGAIVHSVPELYRTICVMWLELYGTPFPLTEEEFTAERPNITTMESYFAIINRILEGRGVSGLRSPAEENKAFYAARAKRIATDKATWLGENRLYYGVPAMMEGLRAAGITIAVVSSKNEDAIRELFAHHGTLRFVDGCIIGLEKSKERERQFELALQTLQIPAGDCLAYDDASANLLIAQRMGIIPVGAPQGYCKPHELDAFTCARPTELPDLARRLLGV
ncbi:MAG: HAD family hydrolase [Candidatus Aenigmarchaeota archaeon]|nr:HAD family hydrolase [Candidatus Aenigmarchaeota archaeon]